MEKDNIQNILKDTDINKDNIKDNTKEILLKNKPIEDKLHVITVISNPCNYKIRYKLTKEFIDRMEKEPNIILYVVELVYNDQPFVITSSSNKYHLQLHAEIPLWHKENMINLGVKKLLPNDWKAFAWIDPDIDFDNIHWAKDTLKILNDGGKDCVQLFTNCIDMDSYEEILDIKFGFGYQYCKNLKKDNNIHYWHPGYGWAYNRKAFEQMGGLMQEAILGEADNIMAHGFIEKAVLSLKVGMDPKYIDFIKNYQNKIMNLKIGYVPGTIRHFFHGSNQNINYCKSEDILINFKFNPYTFIKINSDGLIVPSNTCPKEFTDEIFKYFKNLNEDEIIYSKEIINDNSKEALEFKIKFIINEFEKIKNKSSQNTHIIDSNIIDSDINAEEYKKQQRQLELQQHQQQQIELQKQLELQQQQEEYKEEVVYNQKLYYLQQSQQKNSNAYLSKYNKSQPQSMYNTNTNNNASSSLLNSNIPNKIFKNTTTTSYEQKQSYNQKPINFLSLKKFSFN
jgi:hypothetical protein